MGGRGGGGWDSNVELLFGSDRDERGQGREQQRFSQGKLDVLEMKPETDMVWSEELAGRRPRGGAKRKFMDAVEEDMRLADDGEEDAGNGDSWKQVIG